MTRAQFRRLALALPEADERSHMSHPDFRVRGKIFATLSSEHLRATVNLTLDQQEMLVAGKPRTFVPATGGWGRRGWTNILLPKASVAAVHVALEFAWGSVAPKKLREGMDGE